MLPTRSVDFRPYYMQQYCHLVYFHDITSVDAWRFMGISGVLWASKDSKRAWDQYRQQHSNIAAGSYIGLSDTVEQRVVASILSNNHHRTITDNGDFHLLAYCSSRPKHIVIERLVHLFNLFGILSENILMNLLLHSRIINLLFKYMM